jgi:hypothetical protein
MEIYVEDAVGGGERRAKAKLNTNQFSQSKRIKS